MLKRELTAVLARRFDHLKAKDVELMVRLVFEAMTEALVQGREIELRGFGSFRLRSYEPRSARNPGTGEKLSLGPRRGIQFRPGREIKKRLND